MYNGDGTFFTAARRAASGVAVGLAVAATFAACGPSKTPADLERETTAAEVLRLVPGNVDVVGAARSLGRGYDLAAASWKAATSAEPVAGLVADEIARDVKREWPMFTTFSRDEFVAKGLRLEGGVAAFERGSYPDKVEGLVLPVNDPTKLLALVEEYANRRVAEVSGATGAVPPLTPYPPGGEGVDDTDLMDKMPAMEMELEPPPPPPTPPPEKAKRAAHPAGRGIVSFTGRDWEDFRYDVAFRDGYALVVGSRSTWDAAGSRMVPPEPSKLPVEWLDLKREESLWETRFAHEFADARKPHDGLLFVSLTGTARKEMEHELADPDVPGLVRDLAETRGFLFTGRVGDGGEVVMHGVAPNPMVGRIVKYVRPAAGGGDPMRVVGPETHDLYRMTFNLDELYALLPKKDAASLESSTKADVGMDLHGDVVGNFTGAAVFAMGARWDQVTFAAGVRDEARTEKLLDWLAKSVELVKYSAESMGAKVSVTTETHGAAKVRVVTLEPKGGAVFRTYLGAGKGLLVVTTDPAMLERAFGGGGAAAAPATPSFPGEMANPGVAQVFGGDFFAGGYYRVVDPAKAVRAMAERFGVGPGTPVGDLISGWAGDLRHFPEGLEPRERTAVDAARYVMDRVFDMWGGYGLRGDGFVFDFTLRPL
ncbi:MAG TPA: hypothetical protein VG389_26085 [Myxococcota bacterium]|jgi:hypothetical protein|nr:hypothetical protein [Myxococcota bacterium]